MKSELGKKTAGPTALSSARLINSFFFFGLILGFSLIAISIGLDFIVKNQSFSIHSSYNLISSTPVYWVVLTAPVFLGLVFFIMGRVISTRETRLEEHAQADKKRSLLLQDYFLALENGDFETRVAQAFENKTFALQLERFREKLMTDKTAAEKQAWENTGLAAFGDLVRSVDNTQQLSNEAIRFVVKHLRSNHGAVFILNNSNKGNETLDLTASYAFDGIKNPAQSIDTGQGLVGQCFSNKETIVLYDVPQNYIKITSGLGMAAPSCIVIVPLKSSDQVIGVMEVASFNRLEQHQIQFLEKVAEVLASVFQSTRTNDNIKQLLSTSQQQTEQLRSQEEEMMQNMEELQAVQEQLARQLEENTRTKKDLEARESVLARTTILSETDIRGTITFVNTKFCEVSQYTSEELVGKAHNFVRHPDMPKEIFKAMWSTIKKGEIFNGIVKNKKKDGTHYWVDATIVPIIENGKIVKYIGARYHIQDEAIARKLYDEQVKKLQIPTHEEPLAPSEFVTFLN
jgi:PAS domain S-box-containing protein